MTTVLVIRDVLLLLLLLTYIGITYDLPLLLGITLFKREYPFRMFIPKTVTVYILVLDLTTMRASPHRLLRLTLPRMRCGR